MPPKLTDRGTNSQPQLSTRIALAASALTVLFILVVGGTSYFVTRGQITQGVQSALENNALLLSDRFSSSLGSVVNTLGELRHNALILNSLMDSLTRNTSLEPFLADFSSINGIPVDIALTDFEGNAVAGKRSVADITSLWKKPVLEDAVPYISIENNADSVYLLFADPLFYTGTLSPEGALINKIELTRLIQDLNTLGGFETVSLLQHGEPIGLQSSSSANQPQAAPKLTRIRSLDLPEPLAHLGLAVRVSASPEVVNQPLDRLTFIYILLGMVLLVVVILLSIFAGGHLAKPLRELEKVAASVVASNSFDHRFTAGGYSEVTRLGNTFNRMLESLGAAHEQVTILAHSDVLTGLANRALFQTRLRASLQDIQRSDVLLGILLIDLDKFKDINDTLGHPVGDELLKQVAERLRKLVRVTDTVARLGGDEFVIIATHLNKADDAGVLGQTIMESMSRPFHLRGNDIHVTASVGIAICGTDGDDPHQLLSNADMALYKAKEEGRANFQFFDPRLNSAAQKRKQMEGSIRMALDQSAFCLHYQPKIDLLTGKIVGVEALVRWQGLNGLVYPGEFIQIAEESGLIVPLGEWILREACLQKLSWDKSGLRPFTVAVNLSAVQLRQDNYIERLLQVIKETGVDPSGLQIEITESALMDKMDSIARRLGCFQEIGVSLAIDDIGTGYSSLSNLKLLSVDVLKIDRSFIRDIEIDANDAAITRAVVQLGRSLDLTVVAEGVETSEQADFLRLQGCHQSQGYLHSPALSGPELAAWIETHDFLDDFKTPSINPSVFARKN